MILYIYKLPSGGQAAAARPLAARAGPGPAARGRVGLPPPGNRLWSFVYISYIFGYIWVRTFFGDVTVFFSIGSLYKDKLPKAKCITIL